jgi:CRP/FNR family transcriptional regulator, cyclic AMP receptor protein
VRNSEGARIVRTVLCRGLTQEQSEQIVNAMVPVKAAAGAAVIQQGERGRGLMVLLEGVVEIHKRDADGRDAVITSVKAPAVLGEMSLVSERPHSATVRAATACDIWLLTCSQFNRLLQAESVAAYKLIATLAGVIAGRLEQMDEKVAGLAAAGSRA